MMRYVGVVEGDKVGVVVGQGVDKVGVVVGLGKESKDKGETLVGRGFLGSEWLSGVFGDMTRIRSAGWYGSWFLGPVL